MKKSRSAKFATTDSSRKRFEVSDENRSVKSLREAAGKIFRQDRRPYMKQRQQGIKANQASVTTVQVKADPIQTQIGQKVSIMKQSDAVFNRIKAPRILCGKRGKKYTMCTSCYVKTTSYANGSNQTVSTTRHTPRTTRRKNFDYFVFNIVDYGVNYGLLRSGARRRALA
jgi:hypothetical protein